MSNASKKFNVYKRMISHQIVKRNKFLSKCGRTKIIKKRNFCVEESSSKETRIDLADVKFKNISEIGSILSLDQSMKKVRLELVEVEKTINKEYKIIVERAPLIIKHKVFMVENNYQIGKYPHIYNNLPSKYLKKIIQLKTEHEMSLQNVIKAERLFYEKGQKVTILEKNATEITKAVKFLAQHPVKIGITAIGTGGLIAHKYFEAGKFAYEGLVFLKSQKEECIIKHELALEDADRFGFSPYF